MRLWLGLAALLALGCSDASSAGSGGGGGTAGGGGEGGEAALCSASERPLGDGACQPPGVPPDDCGDGFTPEAGGCLPVLPPAPCPAGSRARLGDAACQAIGPCGAAPWGDIPVEPNSVYVDQGAPAGGDGTAAAPFTSLQQGIDAAPDGAIVAVAAGSYSSGINIASKAVRVWGVCATEVAVVGPSFATVIMQGASGSELHGLGITGPAGIAIVDSVDVELEGLWVHDMAERGIQVENAFGPVEVTVRSSLVENVLGGGLVVAVAASDDPTSFTVDDVEVRGVRDLPSNPTLYGAGLVIDSLGTPTEVSVSRSIFRDNHDAGISGANSMLTVTETVVADNVVNEGFGGGIVLIDVDGVPSMTLERTVVLDQDNIGIGVRGGDLTVRDSTLIGVAPTLPDRGGSGLLVQASDNGVTPQLTVRQSLTATTGQTGILGIDAAATIESVIVRDGLGTSDGRFGRGIEVHQRTADVPGSLALRWSRVTDVRDVGALLAVADMEVESVLIHDVSAAIVPGFLTGAGLNVGALGIEAFASTAHLRRVEVARTSTAGLYILGVDTEVEDLSVRDVATSADGQFGDGIASVGPQLVNFRSIEAINSARVGLALFASRGSVTGARLECNTIDLGAEQGAELSDDGDNRCFCEDESKVCQALSANLAPPDPLGLSPGE